MYSKNDPLNVPVRVNPIDRIRDAMDAINSPCSMKKLRFAAFQQDVLVTCTICPVEQSIADLIISNGFLAGTL